MKEVIQSEYTGYCFGVREAFSKAEKTAAAYAGTEVKIYTFGPLIHNKDAVLELEEQGIRSIFSLDEAEDGSVIIIRSHGVALSFYEEAEKRNITIVDATCMFVRKIQEAVKQAHAVGSRIAIIGSSTHPEVIGINGWCGNTAYILESEADAEKIEETEIFLVAQTTITEELWDRIVEHLKSRKIKIIENKTICSETKNRQKACAKLASEVDAMLVIGGRDSSNTRKLYELSLKNCRNAYLIERKEDLPLKDIENCNRIGIATGASTPERIIKEVIATMSEVITDKNEDMEEEKNQMHDLMAEIEKSLRLPSRGEIINGEIIQVTNREVVVNLGCKKDGILPKDEVTLEPGQELTEMFKAGDTIEAKVLKTDDGDGNILLSKKKLEVNEHWDEITSAIENKSFVNAKVVKEVKGGVIAVYKEVSGFIPMSQLSDRYIEKADEFIGKVLPVRVTRVDQKRNKAVFSHKAFLNEERNKKVAEIWNSLSVGDIVEGTVMRFTDYGAFVDIGGLDGLLHISEISWGKLKHPQEALKIGEKVQAKILSMNAEKGKISLGLKQNTPEPWAAIDENYTVGTVVQGKVVQLKEYGAFIELQPGLDGLVHISEIAHKRVTNIGNELQIGQIVSAKILEIDKEKKRISLSIKETIEPPTPEELAAEREAAAAAKEAAAAAKEAAAEESEPVHEDKAVQEVTCPYDPNCESVDEDPEDAHDVDVTEPEEIEAEVDIANEDVVIDKVLV